MGGLGNQIFIYAFVKNLMIKNPKMQIYLDTSWYDNNNIREFELLNYQLDSKVQILDCTQVPVGILIKYKLSILLYKWCRYFYKKKIDRLFPWLSKKGFFYNGHKYSDVKIENKIEWGFVYGYYQDNKYIEQVKSQLLQDMSLKNESYKYKEYKSIIDDNTCAISIRWGNDYVACGYPICSGNYFNVGLEYILKQKRVSKILVFSDEIEQVKNSDVGKSLDIDIIFIEGLSPCESMNLMVQCSDFVIANSSFSWLGAVIGGNDDSIIVAPEFWTKSIRTKDSRLFVDKMIIL